MGGGRPRSGKRRANRSGWLNGRAFMRSGVSLCRTDSGAVGSALLPGLELLCFRHDRVLIRPLRVAGEPVEKGLADRGEHIVTVQVGTKDGLILHERKASIKMLIHCKG